jgi:hypothetical protein
MHRKNPGTLLSQLNNVNTQSANKLKHGSDIDDNGITHHTRRSRNLVKKNPNATDTLRP